MEKIDVQKIQKLIDSSVEEDICIGTILLYKHFKGNSAKMSAFLKMHKSNIPLEIYYKNLNIVYWHFTKTAIYESNLRESQTIKTIRL